LEGKDGVLSSFLMIFSNLLGALRKIAKKLRKMANDKEFIGMLDHLLDNAQAEV